MMMLPLWLPCILAAMSLHAAALTLQDRLRGPEMLFQAPEDAARNGIGQYQSFGVASYHGNAGKSTSATFSLRFKVLADVPSNADPILLWLDGSSTLGASLVLQKDNLLVLSFCADDSFAHTLQHKLSDDLVGSNAPVVEVLWTFNLEGSYPIVSLWVEGVSREAGKDGVGGSDWTAGGLGSVGLVGSDSYCIPPETETIDTDVVEFVTSKALRFWSGRLYEAMDAYGDVPWQQPYELFGRQADSVVSGTTLPTFNGLQVGSATDVASEHVTFHFLLDTTNKTTGDPEIVFEAGDESSGVSLIWRAPNTLEAWLCGGVNNTAGQSYELPVFLASSLASPITVMLSLDVTNSKLLFYVDGTLLETDAISLPDGSWTSNDGAGIGVKGGAGVCYPSTLTHEPSLESARIYGEGIRVWAGEVVSLEDSGVCLNDGLPAYGGCICPRGWKGPSCEIQTDGAHPKTCFEAEFMTGTGPLTLDPDDLTDPFDALCDMDTAGGGWTLCGKFDHNLDYNLRFPFGRSNFATNYPSLLKDITTFVTSQASQDCRKLMEGNSYGHFLHVGTNSPTILDYNMVRITPILDEVLQDPTNLWDINVDTARNEAPPQEESCQALSPVYTADGQYLYRDQNQIQYGYMVVGRGTHWTNWGREGAMFSTAGVSSCYGTHSDSIYWGWYDIHGSTVGYGCGANARINMIGTWCNRNSRYRSTFRYNLIYVRATPAVPERVSVDFDQGPSRNFRLAGSFTLGVNRGLPATFELFVNLLSSPSQEQQVIFATGDHTSGLSLLLEPNHHLSMRWCGGGSIAELVAEVPAKLVRKGQVPLVVTVDNRAGSRTQGMQLFVDNIPLGRLWEVPAAAWSNVDSVVFAKAASGICGAPGPQAISAANPSLVHINIGGGFRIYENRVWENADKCLSSPCQNGGRCTDGFEASFVCQCAPGFSGSTCDVDVEEPVLDCPAEVKLATLSGQSSVTLEYTVDVSDNSGEDLVASCSTPSGTDIPAGTRFVTCTATDSGSNEGSCTFKVTVSDGAAPEPVCPADIVRQTSPGTGIARVTWPPLPNAPDDTGSFPVFCSPVPGSVFFIGETTVTCSATDTSNNVGECTFTVTIEDVEPPSIQCKPPANPVFATDETLATATVTFASPTVTDNSAQAITPVCEPASGSSVPLGNHLVNCTATDSAGLTDSCSFAISVVDDEPPFISCPTPPFVASLPPQRSSTVTNYTVPPATDNSGEAPPVTCYPDRSAILPVGDSPIFCNASDSAGNVGSCYMTVRVLDQEAPGITCPPSRTIPTEPDEDTAVATFPDPKTFDNVAVNETSCILESGIVLPLGVTEVNCTAIDSSGNTASCDFTITVTDRQPPSITCPSDQVTTTLLDEPYAAVSWNEPSASDNVPGSIQVTCSPASGAALPLGETTVTCTALDSAANEAKCTFGVTVEDDQAPAITCPANITVPTRPGSAQAIIATVPRPSAQDNVGATSATCQWPPQGTFSLGRSQVSCTAEDAAGNAASCPMFVTVEDREPPTVTCPPNQVLSAASAQNPSATASFSQPSVQDNAGSQGLSVSCNATSGSAFDVGNNLIVCTAQDERANEASCSFSIVVVEFASPSLTCPQDITSGDGAVTWAPVPAVDQNYQALPTTCNPPSGSVFNIGTTQVLCQAKDALQRIGVCTFDVIVEDQTPPEITCPADIAVDALQGTNSRAVSFSVTGTDNSGVQPTVACDAESGGLFPIGLTSISCTATDGSGLSSTCDFSVTVNDQEPPVIACPSSLERGTSPGQNTAVVSFGTATARDNDRLASVACTPSSGSAFELGTTPVVCTAVDESGLDSECRFNVTVRDNEPPSLSCSSVTFDLPSSQSTASKAFALPQATDNVNVTSVVCSPDPSEALPIGGEFVTCDAEDAAGNSGRCTFNVLVRDVTAPSISCPGNVEVAPELGEQTALVTFSPALAADDIPNNDVTVTCSETSDSLFPLGPSVVTCEAFDPYGNVGDCSFVVTVTDNTPPSLSCPNDRQMATDDGLNTALFPFILQVSDDSGREVTTNCSWSPSKPFPLGQTAVMCNAYDLSNNPSQCSFTVTVIDDEPPSLSCPTQTVERLITHPLQSDVVSIPAPTATDNVDGAVHVNCTLSSSAELALGDHIVTCNASDARDNQAQCDFTVNVAWRSQPCVGAFTAWSGCSPCPNRMRTRTFEVEIENTPDQPNCPTNETEECTDVGSSCVVVQAVAEFEPIVRSVWASHGSDIYTFFETKLIDHLKLNWGLFVDYDSVQVSGVKLSALNANRRRAANGVARVTYRVHTLEAEESITEQAIDSLSKGDEADAFLSSLQPGPFDAFVEVSSMSHSVGSGGEESTSGSSDLAIYAALGAVCGVLIIVIVVLAVLLRRRKPTDAYSEDKDESMEMQLLSRNPSKKSIQRQSSATGMAASMKAARPPSVRSQPQYLEPTARKPSTKAKASAPVVAWGDDSYLTTTDSVAQDSYLTTDGASPLDGIDGFDGFDDLDLDLFADSAIANGDESQGGGYIDVNEEEDGGNMGRRKQSFNRSRDGNVDLLLEGLNDSRHAVTHHRLERVQSQTHQLEQKVDVLASLVSQMYDDDE